MLTIEKVKKSLRKIDDWYEFAENGGKTSLGEIEIVELKEGQGWVSNIFYISSYNFYFQLSGSYNSYEGTEWEDVDDIVQVYPHIITKTEYRVKESVDTEIDIHPSLSKFKYVAGVVKLPEDEVYHLSNNILTRIK